MIPFSFEGLSMNKFPVRSAAALALALGFAIAAPAQVAKDPAPAAQKPVSVNGKPIPKSRLDFIVKQRSTQGQPDSEQTRKQILDNLISQEVVAQEAERRGLAKSADVRAQLDLARQGVLVQ